MSPVDQHHAEQAADTLDHYLNQQDVVMGSSSMSRELKSLDELRATFKLAPIWGPPTPSISQPVAAPSTLDVGALAAGPAPSAEVAAVAAESASPENDVENGIAGEEDDIAKVEKFRTPALARRKIAQPLETSPPSKQSAGAAAIEDGDKQLGGDTDSMSEASLAAATGKEASVSKNTQKWISECDLVKAAVSGITGLGVPKHQMELHHKKLKTIQMNNSSHNKYGSDIKRLNEHTKLFTAALALHEDVLLQEPDDAKVRADLHRVTSSFPGGTLPPQVKLGLLKRRVNKLLPTVGSLQGFKEYVGVIWPWLAADDSPSFDGEAPTCSTLPQTRVERTVLFADFLTKSFVFLIESGVSLTVVIQCMIWFEPRLVEINRESLKWQTPRTSAEKSVIGCAISICQGLVALITPTDDADADIMSTIDAVAILEEKQSEHEMVREVALAVGEASAFDAVLSELSLARKGAAGLGASLSDCENSVSRVMSETKTATTLTDLVDAMRTPVRNAGNVTMAMGSRYGAVFNKKVLCAVKELVGEALERVVTEKIQKRELMDISDILMEATISFSGDATLENMQLSVSNAIRDVSKQEVVARFEHAIAICNAENALPINGTKWTDLKLAAKALGNAKLGHAHQDIVQTCVKVACGLLAKALPHTQQGAPVLSCLGCLEPLLPPELCPADIRLAKVCSCCDMLAGSVDKLTRFFGKEKASVVEEVKMAEMAEVVLADKNAMAAALTSLDPQCDSTTVAKASMATLLDTAEARLSQFSVDHIAFLGAKVDAEKENFDKVKHGSKDTDPWDVGLDGDADFKRVMKIAKERELITNKAVATMGPIVTSFKQVPLVV